jgi:hypothetical protein
VFASKVNGGNSFASFSSASPSCSTGST